MKVKRSLSHIYLIIIEPKGATHMLSVANIGAVVDVYCAFFGSPKPDLCKIQMINRLPFRIKRNRRPGVTFCSFEQSDYVHIT